MLPEVPMASKEAFLREILEAVGNGYNHVEGRLNDVQNKRIPLIEQHIRSYEESQSKANETAKQLQVFTERLDAAEAGGYAQAKFTAELSETIKELKASHATAYASAVASARRVDSLSESIQKLEADMSSNRNDSESFSTIIEKVEKISETVTKLQKEREADAGTIRSLSETVKNLQAERTTDALQVKHNAAETKKLQDQQSGKADMIDLQKLSKSVDKMQADRDSDCSLIQTATKNVNWLQSQQAEKANKTGLNVLSQKIDRFQAEERERVSAMDTIRSSNRKAEDRITNIEKQFKYLDDQSRKTETVYSDIAGLSASIGEVRTRLEKRLGYLETKNVDSNKVNATLSSLFKRIDRLEARDPSITTVNAHSQTLLRRVEKLTGDDSDISKFGAYLKALQRRVDELESSSAERQKIDSSTKDLVARLSKLEAENENEDTRRSDIDHLLKRVELLEACRHEKTQSQSPSVNDLAQTLYKRLSEGEVFDDTTKTFIRTIAFNNSTGNLSKNESDLGAYGDSITLAEGGAKKVSIQKMTSPEDAPKKRPAFKEPQVHLTRHTLKRPSQSKTPEQNDPVQYVDPSRKSTLKRTLDAVDGAKNVEQSHKRPKSAAGNERASRSRVDFHDLSSKGHKNSWSISRSSPTQGRRFRSRRNESVQTAVTSEEGESDEEEEEEDSEDDLAPRRSSRTVKPTERGSHLAFMETNGAKLGARRSS